MLEVMFHKFLATVAAIPFTGPTWFVLAILGFFLWLFSKAHKDPKSKIDWEDLIVSTDTNRASPYKLGYLVGVIVSTWVVVAFADSNRLSFDILGVYLTYLVGGIGANVLAKKAISKIQETTPEPDNKATAPAPKQ